MRIVALLTLIVFGVIQLAAQQNSPPIESPNGQRATPKSSAPITEQKDDSKDKQKTAAKSTPAVPKTGAPPENGNTPAADENIDIQRKISGFTAQLAKFTEGLLVVGALQVVVLCVQAWILKRQTAIYRNSERAWLIASPIERSPELYFMPEAGDPVGTAMRNVFAVSIQNKGRTPAHILETSLYYKTLQTLEEIPTVPFYKNVITHEGLVLIPDGEPIGQVAYLQPDTFLRKAKAVAIQNRESYVFAYGFVQYRDVFDASHRTQFGYLYNFPQGGEPQALKGFMPKGPKAYNKAT